MIGVAAPRPGSSTDQRRLDLTSSLSGRLVSVVEPLRAGPRHWAQFSAKAEETRPAERRAETVKVESRRRSFIGNSPRFGGGSGSMDGRLGSSRTETGRGRCCLYNGGGV